MDLKPNSLWKVTLFHQRFRSFTPRQTVAEVLGPDAQRKGATRINVFNSWVKNGWYESGVFKVSESVWVEWIGESVDYHPHAIRFDGPASAEEFEAATSPKSRKRG
jgi:hypothetical protein